MSDGLPARSQAPPFAQRVATRSRELGTSVCLGIDPRPAAHPLTSPGRFDGDPAKTARAVVHYFQAIVQATSDLVACYKLQSAFFEVLGIPGLIALAQLLADIREAGVPAILDAKRGDIGSTSEAYANAYLAEGVFNADALTVNPYLGLDTLEPFVKTAMANGRGVLVLLKTSNPGSGDLQDLRLEGGEQVWQRLATKLADLAEEGLDERGFTPVGVVAGATYPQQLVKIRALLPHSLILVPGFGAQGGTAETVAPAFADGGLAVVSASRSLTYLSESDDFAEQAKVATRKMRDDLNRAVDAHSAH